MGKKIRAAMLIVLGLAWGANAAEFVALAGLGGVGLKGLFASVPEASPARAAGGFLVEGNARLLADFGEFFDYKVDGHAYFRYDLKSLRFYRLAGWPRRLLVRIDDRTLPDFHNFAVLDLEGETGYRLVYRYGSQAAGKYDDSTVAEKVCALDAACELRNRLKKAAEAAASRNLGSWESFYFERTKPALLSVIGRHYDTAKFGLLDPEEISSAKARFAGILAGARFNSSGKGSLLEGNRKGWKTEFCGNSSVELLERVKAAAPEEQDKMLLRCGLALDAEWLIKREYDGLLIEQLNRACAEGYDAPVNRDYCTVYRGWLDIYPRTTRIEELVLVDGRLAI